MVVDIQREYRFYSESGNTPSKNHGHTPEIRRNRLQGTPPSSGQNVRFHLLNPGRKGDFYVQKNYRYNTQGFIS